MAHPREESNLIKNLALEFAPFFNKNQEPLFDGACCLSCYNLPTLENEDQICYPMVS